MEKEQYLREIFQNNKGEITEKWMKDWVIAWRERHGIVAKDIGAKSKK